MHRPTANPIANPPMNRACRINRKSGKMTPAPERTHNARAIPLKVTMARRLPNRGPARSCCTGLPAPPRLPTGSGGKPPPGPSGFSPFSLPLRKPSSALSSNGIGSPHAGTGKTLSPVVASARAFILHPPAATILQYANPNHRRRSQHQENHRHGSGNTGP